MKLLTNQSQISLMKKNDNAIALLAWDANMDNQQNRIKHALDEHPWRDYKKRQEAKDYIQKLYIYYLDEITRELNKKLVLNLPIKYWERIVGMWLFTFINIYYDRWSQISKIVEFYKDIHFTYIPLDTIEINTKDYLDFQEKNQTEAWNDALYQFICKNFKEIFIEEIKIEDKSRSLDDFKINLKQKRKKVISLTNLVIEIIKLLSKLKLTKFNKVNFHMHYFSLKYSVLLSIFLKSIPTYTVRKKLPEYAPQQEMRNLEINPMSNSGLNKSLSEILKIALPTCYLEGYENNTNEIPEFPSLGGIIYTANAFSSDDRWKFWSAKRSLENSTLFIAQHGGYYGLTEWSAYEFIETRLCDYYLTWGWKNGPKTIPAPANKLISLKQKQKYSQKARGNSYMTLILNTVSKYSVACDAGILQCTYKDYLDDIVSNFLSFPGCIQQQMLIRGSKAYHSREIEKRFVELGARFDTDLDYLELMKNSKLTIHTFNSTTFLETMTLNIPTIVYLSKDLWPLNKKYSELYKHIEKYNILIRDREKLVEVIKSVDTKEKIDKWWFSDETQEAKNCFLNTFGYVGDSPIRELKAILENPTSLAEL